MVQMEKESNGPFINYVSIPRVGWRGWKNLYIHLLWGGKGSNPFLHNIFQRFLWETIDNYSGHEELFTENFIMTITEASISHKEKYCVY
jgi:hypothetical protein